MGLRSGQIPGSVEEARQLVAYFRRFIDSSRDVDRRRRAERSLAKLQPHVDRLEREEQERVRRIETQAPPVAAFDGRLQAWRDAKADDPEYDVVWNGGEGLSSYATRRGLMGQ